MGVAYCDSSCSASHSRDRDRNSADGHRTVSNLTEIVLAPAIGNASDEESTSVVAPGGNVSNPT
jgi:hypothetical protein